MLIYWHHGVRKLFVVKGNFPQTEEGGSNDQVRAVVLVRADRKIHVPPPDQPLSFVELTATAGAGRGTVG